MADGTVSSDTPRVPSEPVTISEFRARLAEMVGRAEQGEEVVIARGREPVAKLVPLRDKRRRRLGVLREFIGEQALAQLTETIEKPLLPRTRCRGGASSDQGVDVRRCIAGCAVA